MTSPWLSHLKQRYGDRFVDCLRGGRFAQGGEDLDFGIFVVRNAVPADLTEQWRDKLNQYFEDLRGIGQNMARIGNADDYYSSVQAVQNPCTCLYKYDGTKDSIRRFHHITDNPATAVPFEWIHADVKMRKDDYMNLVVANGYDNERKQCIPWHSDSDVLFNERQEVVSISAGAPALFAWTPHQNSEWARYTFHKKQDERLRRGYIQATPLML